MRREEKFERQILSKGEERALLKRVKGLLLWNAVRQGCEMGGITRNPDCALIIKSPVFLFKTLKSLSRTRYLCLKYRRFCQEPDVSVQRYRPLYHEPGISVEDTDIFVKKLISLFKISTSVQRHRHLCQEPGTSVQ